MPETNNPGKEAYYQSLVARWQADKVAGSNATLKDVKGELLGSHEFGALDQLVAVSQDFLDCLEGLKDGSLDTAEALSKLDLLTAQESELRELVETNRRFYIVKKNENKENATTNPEANSRFSFYDWLTSRVQPIRGDIPFCVGEIKNNGTIEKTDLDNMIEGLKENISLV